MELKNSDYNRRDDVSCQTCIWCDQCADDNVCEYYDDINSDVYTCSRTDDYEDYKISWLKYISQYSDDLSYDKSFM